MKKILVIVTIITLGLIGILFNYQNNNDKAIYESSSTSNNKIVSSNALTMMYETEAGSGEYQVTSDTTWPQEGYVFNEQLSACENGSELSWDDENNRVIVSTSVSDKCYVYFDVYAPIFSDYIINDIYIEDGVNGLYYHDGVGTYGTLEAGDYSYRFAGANPNNYVCFGSDEETCPAENLYRIIGVFNGQVKLIKAISYGEYSWGDNENINEWNTDIKPDIYTTLNNLFYNSLEIEWQDLISLHDYNVEGMSQNDSFGVKQYYDAEIKNNNGYNQNMKIGLMYVTDYGYAASPEAWTIEMFNYDDSKNLNWLSGITEWTISRRADVTGYTFRIDESGYVRGDYYVAFAFSIRPSFYLNSDVEIYEGHAGTVSDPYGILI